MAKKNEEKIVARVINIEVTSKRDKEILGKALVLLDKNGYVIAKKTDLVLESE